MKLLRVFFLAVFVFALVNPVIENSQIKAQTRVSFTKGDGSTLLQFPTVKVDSATATPVTSEWFSITKYDGNSFYTYPISYSKKLTAPAGKSRVTTTIEGSNDQVNVVVVDTAGIVADSVATYQTGTLNLNNKKFLYYRVKHTGESTNRKNVTAYFDLFFTKPDAIN